VQFSEKLLLVNRGRDEGNLNAQGEDFPVGLRLSVTASL
jgi:hypothetical protein